MENYKINIGYGFSKKWVNCLSPEEIRKTAKKIDFKEVIENLFSEYGNRGNRGNTVSAVLDIRDGKIYNVLDSAGTYRCESASEIEIVSWTLDNEEYDLDLLFDSRELKDYDWDNDTPKSFSKKLEEQSGYTFDERISNCDESFVEEIWEMFDKKEFFERVESIIEEILEY
jgi:hypothetical protein